MKGLEFYSAACAVLAKTEHENARLMARAPRHEVFGDEDAQQLKSDAPDWAQDPQAKLDDAKPDSRVPLVRKNFLRSGQVRGKVIVPPADAPDR